jgi:hypothetical protein
MTTKQWKVGEVYFAACGQLGGREWDLGHLGVECETKAKAEENAATWIHDLTKNEQKRATTYVQVFLVKTIDEDGAIGMAESV